MRAEGAYRDEETPEGARLMHPFYGPHARAQGGGSSAASVVSMAAYLTFWGVVVALGRRELEARFPRRGVGDGHDQALSVLRERYARGELDDDEFRRMHDVLTGRQP